MVSGGACQCLLLLVLTLAACATADHGEVPGSEWKQHTDCNACTEAGFGWSEKKRKCSPGFRNRVCATGAGAGSDSGRSAVAESQYLHNVNLEQRGPPPPPPRKKRKLTRELCIEKIKAIFQVNGVGDEQLAYKLAQYKNDEDVLLKVGRPSSTHRLQ